MPPRIVGAGTQPTASKASKKDRIIQALSRMNDRDTQKAAAEDLFSILLNMDQEGLPIILNGLCTTGAEYKVYARKECARAIGIIASDACPLRDQALQQPHLGKMLGQLRKSLQDADSSVREASAEALALVAQGLAQLAPGAALGTLANPVVKLIFDCLVEQKKDMNAAACTALGMAAPHLGTLDLGLSRELVRKLNSPTFQAPAALLAALARLDPATGEPVGLLKSGPAAFVPLMSSLVGQLATGGVSASASGGSGGGSGAVAALSRPEWPVRLAAADMLRATAMLLGPLMELDGCWTAGDARSITGRAIRGLESCRFDKVRDVRDVARAALGVMEELQAYGSQGGSPAGWPSHIAMKLYGTEAPVQLAPPTGRRSPARRSVTSPGRRRPQPQTLGPPQKSRSPPRRSPTPPERRSSPVFARGGSLAERFRAAHREGDGVAVLYPGASADQDELQDAEGVEGGGSVQQAEDLAGPPRPPVQAWPGDGTLADAVPSSRGMSRHQSKGANEASRQAAAPLAVEQQFSVRSLAGQAQQYQQQPSSSSAALADDPAGMLGSLRLDDSLHSLMDSAGPPTFSRYAAEPSRLCGAPLDAFAVSAEGVPASRPVQPHSAAQLGPPPSVAPPTVTLPTEEWLAAQQRLRSLEDQHRQLLEAFDSLSAQSSQAIKGLQAKVLSLEAALGAAQSQLALATAQPPPPGPEPSSSSPVDDEVERSWMSRTIKPGSPLLPPAGGGASGLLGRPVPSVRVSAEASSLRASVPGLAPESSFDGASVACEPLLSPVAASDIRQAYRDALSGGRMSNMHLLRLMQRTGPAWNDLGLELASQLLASFVASLQQARADGPMISRMMPWLWRLADDQQNTFAAPQELRAPLLSALCGAQPSVTDPVLYEKVTLLVSTLRAHWSLPDPASAPQRIPTSAPPAALPAVRTTPLEPIYGPGQPPQAAQFTGPVPPRSSAGGAIPVAAPNPAGWAAVSQVPDVDAAGPAAVAFPSPVASESPVPEAVATASATPRFAAVRSSQARTPSISTLMGQWSDLQRDFAAMASPKVSAHTTGQ